MREKVCISDYNVFIVLQLRVRIASTRHQQYGKVEPGENARGRAQEFSTGLNLISCPIFGSRLINLIERISFKVLEVYAF